MTQAYDKLRGLLEELFQFDRAEDLDFGIYRIMNQKRDEVSRFLNEDLIPQVRQAFNEYRVDDETRIYREIEEVKKGAAALGVPLESSVKYQELEARLKRFGDLTTLENEVYSDLYTFFRRYYKNGDFLSLRRYKPGVYAVPYEGEEVKLHWANADQYYVKTAENFRTYRFKLEGVGYVSFGLVAATTERDNNEAANGKERRFVLRAEESVEETDGELHIYFEYRPHPDKQKDLNTRALTTIFEKVSGAWKIGLAEPRPTQSNKNRTLLEKRLNEYTARNTFDYFIHKNLDAFLRRELDFFLKSEVLHIDDLDTENEQRVGQYLSRLKVIKRIGHKIIAFLAHIEDFQRKLFLKTKFVVRSDYCLTLDNVPRDLYEEIVANDEQYKEWERLFAISEISPNLENGSAGGAPRSVEWLEANPYLVLDTKFFEQDFKDRLLVSIEGLDEKTGGLLINSENFQALNQYIFGLFGVESFDELAEGLKEPEYEEWDENNVSRMHHVLAARFFSLPSLSTDDLLRYDQNIVGHTLKISEGRDERIRWKYFQYLSLLFAEIYLDRYFRDSDALLADLNAYVHSFNEGEAEADQVPEYATDDLRKLAFWMATGSGKTLLMHVNLLQYRHYLGLHDRTDEVDRTILLTPNEGLSRQHQQELEKSGFGAELFSKSGESLFTGHRIQILEITKLREDSGVKTVAVEAFEGNNLVLVDEGHRGTSNAKDVIGDKGWKPMRDALCEGGFSFEYSATFGQAMKVAGNKDLADEYARCILFDYSYRHFYGDGYGKDYRVLNLEEANDSFRHRYLVAALLTFHQQQVLYVDREREFYPYGLERPPWMFVGSSVTKSPSKSDRTDVVNILLFLSRFVQEPEESVGILERLMSGRTNLNYKGRDLFADRFNYLVEKGLTAEELYDSILSGFFNATGRARLHAAIVKGAEGEISLHLGDNEAFAVINVGDPSALSKLLEEQEDLVVSEQSISGSLFDNLNTRESSINLLIGARKFTEGWSSWRVSSMGLMNVGKNESSQIIQLFGRGVRLKGLDFSLKRSSSIPDTQHPRHIGILETLNVFGVSADYMQQFKEHLEEEGLPSNDDLEEIVLPVLKTLDGKKLKTIRLRKGGDFRKNGSRLELDLPASLSEVIARKLTVNLDWYPKIGALGSENGTVSAVRDTGKLEARHLAFMELDEVYFELIRHKRERGWHNLTLSREKIVELLKNPDWYELTIPSEDLEFEAGSLRRQVRVWQEIATSLLKAYCKKYYDTRRTEFESGFLQYQELTADDPNFLEEYRFQVEASAEATVMKLKELKAAIEDGRFESLEWGALDIFSFDHHLYTPLVHLKNKDITVKPVALNEGEQRLVKDLKAFREGQPEFFQGKELYLLRNMSRGKGIGFFEAGNFYPDFILWLVVGEQQNVAFIDPKGIRNLEGLTDSKIEFYRTIKEIERRLGEPSVTLSSFIVSNTPYDEVAFWGNKSDLEERNVLFQREDRQTYVKKMLYNMFAANADVNTMWERYGQYLGGREPLMSMANYCLTRLEETIATQRQKRKSAADTYHIDMRVLSRLGDLTANVGDHLGARKAANQGKSRLPTAQEIAWVEAAVKRIIHRAAEYAADPQKRWPQITMDSFPAI